MAPQKKPHQRGKNSAVWCWGVAAAAVGLFCLGLILAGAQSPAIGTCRVVARRVVAEKTDADGRHSYLVAVAVSPLSEGDSDTAFDTVTGDDDDDEADGSVAHVSASWVDAAELDALWRRWRPGVEAPCAGDRGLLSISATPDGHHAKRSDAGDGPRIAAVCAAAAALALVLGCGVVACACKTRWCADHCRPRRAVHPHGSLWGDDDMRHGHRLVDSVFG